MPDKQHRRKKIGLAALASLLVYCVPIVAAYPLMLYSLGIIVVPLLGSGKPVWIAGWAAWHLAITYCLARWLLHGRRSFLGLGIAIGVVPVATIQGLVLNDLLRDRTQEMIEARLPETGHWEKACEVEGYSLARVPATPEALAQGRVWIAAEPLDGFRLLDASDCSIDETERIPDNAENLQFRFAGIDGKVVYCLGPWKAQDCFYSEPGRERPLKLERRDGALHSYVIISGDGEWLAWQNALELEEDTFVQHAYLQKTSGDGLWRVPLSPEVRALPIGLTDFDDSSQALTFLVGEGQIVTVSKDGEILSGPTDVLDCWVQDHAGTRNGWLCDPSRGRSDVVEWDLNGTHGSYEKTSSFGYDPAVSNADGTLIGIATGGEVGHMAIAYASVSVLRASDAEVIFQHHLDVFNQSPDTPVIRFLGDHYLAYSHANAVRVFAIPDGAE